MKINEFSYSGETLRADKIVSEELKITRSAALRLFDENRVSINDVNIPKNRKVSTGETLRIILSEEKSTELLPECIPLDIYYEDGDIIVINKSKGMVVHPGAGNPHGTLVNALLHHCGDSLRTVGEPERPGIVHRLDKDTSGLLIAAKTPAAYDGLVEALKARKVKREYEAVVFGIVKNDSGTINAPLGRHPVRRTEMTVVNSPSAKAAVSHYEVIERFSKYTHLRVSLETGRTHQIRVHLKHLGHPVAGDPVYASKRKAGKLDTQCLHSRRVAFRHPVTGELVDIISKLPEYFEKFLKYTSKIQ